MPYDNLIRDETAESVKKVISRMPAKLREIIVLAYFHKSSYAEISKALGIPVGRLRAACTPRWGGLPKIGRRP